MTKSGIAECDDEGRDARRNALGDDIAQRHAEDDDEGQRLIDIEGRDRRLDDHHNADEAEDDRRHAADADPFAQQDHRQQGHGQRHGLHHRRQVGDLHVHQRRDESDRGDQIEAIAQQHHPAM